MFLLDTDIATLVFRKHERVLTRLSVVDADEVALTAVTRLEILRGRIDAFVKAVDGTGLLLAVEGLAKAEAFLSGFRIVAVDQVAATRFDHLRADKKLNKMGAGDRLQAAIALATGATLVTRNTKDYAAVPGLKLENWAA